MNDFVLETLILFSFNISTRVSLCFVHNGIFSHIMAARFHLKFLKISRTPFVIMPGSSFVRANVWYTALFETLVEVHSYEKREKMHHVLCDFFYSK